jgi:hypothetical protein
MRQLGDGHDDDMVTFRGELDLLLLPEGVESMR